MKKLTIYIIFFLIIHSTSFAIDKKDIQKLKDLNYPLESFYIDNYRGSNTYWISIEKHIELKPKFVALLEQDLKLNGKNISYKFFYNSRHNFFKMIKIKNEKKGIFKIINPLKKSDLKPDIMDDDDLTLDSFVEKVLDHCKFSTLKGVRDLEGKNLNFSKRKACKIKYVNFTKFNNLTFETYEKKSDALSFSLEKDKSLVVAIKTENKILESKSKKINQVKTEYKYIALKWHSFEDLIIGKMDYENNISHGNITLELPNEKTICKGTFGISAAQLGTWSISCPDNPDRQLGFKRNMNASGNIKKNENNHLLGSGKDFLGRKVEFISNRVE